VFLSFHFPFRLIIMDNPQDQSGTTNPNNAGRTSQNPSNTPSSTASGASAASRKSAATPNAQDTATTPEASNQNTANAGTNRQAEGQQTNEQQEGTLLDTALNSGKKWIEDSGMLNSMNQLPQSLKDLGNRAVSRVSELSTTQKVVGGAILAVGLGWLATRKGSKSSESAPFNYGRQRDTGSYGRRNYGYQAPDASASRTSTSGAPSRADSGSPYGSSSRFGSNTGIQSGSGRSDNHSASANVDHGARSTSGGQHSKDDGFRSIE
jgi:hypothetical protein